MINIQEVQLAQIQEHERRTGANVRLDQYGIDKICPIGEVKIYYATLSAGDNKRIFLLKEPTFKHFTSNETYLLTDLNAEAGKPERVKSFFEKIDLRKHPELSPVFFGTNLETGSLTAIDGNHRISAQYLSHGTLEGIGAYIYIHPNINSWWGIPDAAK